MPVDGSDSWDGSDQRVLEALERDLCSDGQGRRRFEGDRLVPAPDAASRPEWSAMLLSGALLFAVGTVLAAAVRAESVLFIAVALALFPLAMVPVIRTGASR